jgi:hypothetical protein
MESEYCRRTAMMKTSGPFGIKIILLQFAFLSVTCYAAVNPKTVEHVRMDYWPGERLPNSPSFLSWNELQKIGKNNFGVPVSVFAFYPKDWKPSLYNNAGNNKDELKKFELKKIRVDRRHSRFEHRLVPSNSPVWDRTASYPLETLHECFKVERLAFIPWGFGSGKLGLKDSTDAKVGIPYFRVLSNTVKIGDWKQMKVIAVGEDGKWIENEKVSTAEITGAAIPKRDYSADDSAAMLRMSELGGTYCSGDKLGWKAGNLYYAFFGLSLGDEGQCQGTEIRVLDISRGQYVCQISVPGFGLGFWDAQNKTDENSQSQNAGQQDKFFEVDASERLHSYEPVLNNFGFEKDSSGRILIPLLTPSGLAILRYSIQ